MLTTACAGQAKPEASSSRPAPTAGTMTTASSPATSSTPAIDPNIPNAARAHTPAGAEAFARYYVEQINAVGKKPASGIIASLSSPRCKSCRNYEASMADMAAKSQHYSSSIFQVDGSDLGAATGRDSVGVYVSVHQKPVKVINPDGTVARQVNAAQAQLLYDIAWTDGRWQVKESYVSVRKS